MENAGDEQTGDVVDAHQDEQRDHGGIPAAESVGDDRPDDASDCKHSVFHLYVPPKIID